MSTALSSTSTHAWRQMIGIPAEMLRGISVHHFAHPDDADGIHTLVFDKLVAAQEGPLEFEARASASDGSSKWAAFTVSYVRGRDAEADYLMPVGEDVTERHLLQEELHRQARHDPLTGLPNRRHLLERMRALAATAAALLTALATPHLLSWRDSGSRSRSASALLPPLLPTHRPRSCSMPRTGAFISPRPIAADAGLFNACGTERAVDPTGSRASIRHC
ncbi:PAS domain S-box protein [Nocardia sp. NBC_01730]|nr:PAS domain S-box protein [Nocardia sp. NBC_01730]